MLKESPFVKLRVGVPLAEEEAVRSALGDAGAGKQGAYSNCSGTYRVTGRFVPEEGSHPAIGEVGSPQVVEEVVIETLCHKDVLKDVLAAVRAVHPYEEPPIDIIPRLELE